MASDSGIRQHKQLAMGKDIGVDSVARPGVRKNMEQDRSGKHLDDGSRAVSAPVHHGVAKMPAQANPDHGPHHVHTRKGAGEY